MKLEDLFSRLSYGELSNLSIGNEGRGSIKEEDIPKLVAHVNDGLTRIYSRFVLCTKQLLIEQVQHITNYHLITKYAESAGADVPWPYIKDLPGNLFKGDVIRMADHIDSMEMQLGTVLKELGEMKKQLGVMQESKVKLFAVNTIQKVEHQVQTLRFQVGE